MFILFISYFCSIYVCTPKKNKSNIKSGFIDQVLHYIIFLKVFDSKFLYLVLVGWRL